MPCSLAKDRIEPLVMYTYCFQAIDPVAWLFWFHHTLDFFLDLPDNFVTISSSQFNTIRIQLTSAIPTKQSFEFHKRWLLETTEGGLPWKVVVYSSGTNVKYRLFNKWRRLYQCLYQMGPWPNVICSHHSIPKIIYTCYRDQFTVQYLLLAGTWGPYLLSCRSSFHSL